MQSSVLSDITNQCRNYAAPQPSRSYLVVCDNKVAQQMIQHAYNFFKKECPHLGSAVEVTAKCLGISVKTVSKFKSGPLTETVSKIERKRPRLATSDLDENNKQEIRLVLYDMVKNSMKRSRGAIFLFYFILFIFVRICFYLRIVVVLGSFVMCLNTCTIVYFVDIYVTLESLLNKLKEKCLYMHGIASLAKLLKHLGFSYQKDNNRRALMETPCVASKRRIFLKQFMKNFYSKNKKQVVVLDETWVYANGSVRRSWQDEDPRSVRRKVGDGARYIIINAGNINGFIPNSGKVFKASKSSGDYHLEMNADLFEHWLQDMLSQLTEPSIILLDNASYHSRLSEKRPTSSWRKHLLQEWLETNNVAYDVHATKKTLLGLCRDNFREKEYVVDKIIQEAGHEVLRLPPYHCIFNAIEMVWSQAKRFYDKTILSSNKDVIGTWEKALANVTPTQWKHYFAHTDNIIQQYYEKEKQLIENNVSELIIHLNEDLSSSDSECDLTEM